MESLFECRVRYSKIDEQSGGEKRVTETYLLDALTYTEAEARITEQMHELTGSEFSIAGIRKAKYAEILPSDDGDRWFKARVTFLCLDENSGKEKKVSQSVLAMANDVKDAVDRIVDGMNGTTADFVVTAVAESPIMDYFPLFEKDPVPEDREISRRPADETVAE